MEYYYGVCCGHERCFVLCIIIFLVFNKACLGTYSCTGINNDISSIIINVIININNRTTFFVVGLSAREPTI